ncbi:E3 ubiquitin-protein ligase AMFR [Anabrus simplex]|uniref:E3 ubiquitin-protein ligase AMFR n=1 Tax=Anabrus simplex TaxID=316456 RepID=UPI0035A3AB0F
MPVILLDRLPLPSLRAYTVISIVLLSCSVYYAVQVTSDPNWKANSTSSYDIDGSENENDPGSDSNDDKSELDNSLGFHVSQLMTFMIQEPLCIWTLINMAYCCLILLGKFIQRLVFGELRVSEQQHIKDKFWNFVFYKFIFVFGVINVQYMDEVVLWCSWFSVLGFLHLLAQLCKDRFEYLSFSPTTPGWSHFRLLGLLGIILMLSGFMFLICVAVGFFGGLNTFAFMVAECVQLSVQTLHVILRYALHLYDMRHGGSGSNGRVWEKRGPAAYYTELIFELAALLIDLVHHLHMLLWSNIFLSMASLVICMQLRFLCHEIQRRIKKHRNYLWVLNHMEQNYPMASPEELAENSDNCAICWEKMESARKLPCTHLFHNSCLQSWLEQDTSCPTCRMVLSIQPPAGMDSAGRLEHTLLTGENQNDNQTPNRRPPNHFFHFDGSRYVSWLPSFSVEVTHTQLLRSDQTQPAQTSQLDSMARQVQQLFPHVALSTVIEDLRVTRSVELTIENVLDGRVVSPPPMFQRDSDPQVLEIEYGHGTSVSSSDVSTHWDDLYSLPGNRDIGSSSVEASGNLGGRFSKSSSERERILQLRKDQLLLTARRRYMERHRTEMEPLQEQEEEESVPEVRQRHMES